MMKAERKPEGSGEETAAAARTKEPRQATEEPFTRYVKALVDRSEALSSLAEEMLAELRKTLVREMRCRSLWASPDETERPSPPLDELLSDCYMFVFCKQLPRLLNQLRVNATIDGLVVFYLRNYLHERQKDHEPFGCRISEALHGTVRSAVLAEAALSGKVVEPDPGRLHTGGRNG